ncbi:MAG: carbon-nitrogen hydrolase family protein [Chloroflexi bacterium]|nr:carbon-nitrogen hydrolase family protein [Chloroflexota bacterium]
MKIESRSLSIVVAQFPISLNISENLQMMLSVISRTEENEIVLFPEGALSGYDANPNFLEKIHLLELDEALRKLENKAKKQKIHLIFGSCLHKSGQWYNAGLYFSHNSHPFIYHKINLATNERGHFQAGNHLPVFTLTVDDFSLTAGMQLCREIRFPEQWQYLARSGSEVLFYLTNAIGDNTVVSVWRSHLISRAAENQRFIISANNAHKQQKCPTMIVAPSGNVVAEITSPNIEVLRKRIDLSNISDWYLDQARTDVIKMTSNSTWENTSMKQ